MLTTVLKIILKLIRNDFRWLFMEVLLNVGHACVQKDLKSSKNHHCTLLEPQCWPTSLFIGNGLDWSKLEKVYKQDKFLENLKTKIVIIHLLDNNGGKYPSAYNWTDYLSKIYARKRIQRKFKIRWSSCISKSAMLANKLVVQNRGSSLRVEITKHKARSQLWRP